jgi:hypothetical protein
MYTLSSGALIMVSPSPAALTAATCILVLVVRVTASYGHLER